MLNSIKAARSCAFGWLVGALALAALALPGWVQAEGNMLPSATGPRVAKSLLLDATRAGERIVAVGERGREHVAHQRRDRRSAFVPGRHSAQPVEALVHVVPVGIWFDQMQRTSQRQQRSTMFAQRVISRSFDDPFKLELMLKDIGIGRGDAYREGSKPFWRG